MTLDDLVSKVTDPYERQARLYPALLALLPLLALVTLLYGSKATALTAAVTVAVSCGGLYLTTNLSRELGKRMEVKLYQGWGGKPTTQLLRHRDRTIDPVTKRRYHSLLATKISADFPNKEQEANNQEAADDAYQSGVRWLLDHTRPHAGKEFDLIFKENVAYGFRRNALGMKPIGLVVAVGSILWVLATEGILSSQRPFINWSALPRTTQPAIASLIVSAIMLLLWLLFFTKASARTAAFTYAEALLRACDSL